LPILHLLLYKTPGTKAKLLQRGVVDVDEVRDLIGEISRPDRNAAWQQGLFDAAIEASARFRL
jgi:hypothetical protein